MALEEVKRKEAELKSMMYLYGRYGLWEDWVKFQADARAKRQRQIKEARLKEKMIEVIGIVSLSLAILFMFAGFFYIVARERNYGFKTVTGFFTEVDKTKMENQKWQAIHTRAKSHRRALSTISRNQGVIVARICSVHCC